MADIRLFTMPKWGIEMVEGTVSEWRLAAGTPFKRGDVIALIESDKIANEVEAEFDGTLSRILVPEGEVLPVGSLLGVFATGEVSETEIDAAVAGFKPAGAAAAAAPTPARAIPAQAAKLPTPAAPKIAIPAGFAASPKALAHAEAVGVDPTKLAGSGRKGRVTFQDVDQAARPLPPAMPKEPVSIRPSILHLDHVYASPLAKRLAVQHGVDLAGIVGTGPRGRIRKHDVLALVPATPAPAAPEIAISALPEDVEIIRLSMARRAIARRLSASKSTVPHFYLRTSAAVDELLAVRQALNLLDRDHRVSVNDFLIRATALALAQMPDINIQVHGDEIYRFPHADISVAVAADRGLITPVIRAAETKSVQAISVEMRELAGKAKGGRLQAAEIEGGSFSISNLGMFGVEQFDAIINAPQGAILAVGSTRNALVGDDDAPRIGKVMALSLSCDHRAIDGALGARFLDSLRQLIEAPRTLLAGP